MKYNNDEIDLLKGVIDIDEFLKKNGITIDYSKLPLGIFSPRMTIPFSKYYEIAYLDGEKCEAKGKRKEKADALQRLQSLDERINNAADNNLKQYMEDFRIYTSNAGSRLANRKRKREKERENIMELMKEEMKTVITRKAQATRIIDEGKAMAARLAAAGIIYSIANNIGEKNIEVIAALGGFIVASPVVDWWGERKEKRIKNKYENILRKIDRETEIQKGKVYAQTSLLVVGSLEWHYPDTVKRVSSAE